MEHLKAEIAEQLARIQDILEQKGYVLESDDMCIYTMQYDERYDALVKWLEEAGYSGTVKLCGYTLEGIAVYGLYDSEKVSYSDMVIKLREDAKRQVEEMHRSNL